MSRPTRKPAGELPNAAAAPMPVVSMRQALTDPELLGHVLAGESWRTWIVLLVSLWGEELSDEERVIFKELTGREREPGQRLEEFWACVGRRGGKSRAIAVLIVFIATLVDHSAKIVPGERPVVLCLAPTSRQARLVLDYIYGIISSTPLIAPLLVNKTNEAIELSNGITVEVRPTTFRGTRGFTTVAVVMDEIAFVRSDESVNPDVEILKALRPSLATTGGMLCCISSPHAKRGALYETFRRHYGPDGHPLIMVAKAPTWVTNPSLPRGVIDRAFEEDPEGASAEYGAEFRGDISVFVSREAIEACVTAGVLVRAPLDGLTYFGFVDPSGGSSDSMTLAIAHNERGRVVIDCIAERRAPFSPESVTSEFAELLKSYRIETVVGDRYAGEWPRERFSVHGITYRPAELNRSELYLAFLPLVNSGRLDLPDSPRMVLQFVGLERRTARSGKDSVDHAPGGHDDIANAVAGAASLALVPVQKIPMVAPVIFAMPGSGAPHQGGPKYSSGDLADVYNDRRSSGFSLRTTSWN